MSELRIYKIFAVMAALVLLVTACGPSQPPEDTISTAVAQTVQAQNPTATVPLSPSPIVPTNTPASLVTPAFETVTATALAAAPVEFCTASASLVGETHPDGTIIQPGIVFTKVWQIQNTGTCTWDSRWQLVFNGGDILDGSAVYNLPQPAEPGQIVE